MSELLQLLDMPVKGASSSRLPLAMEFTVDPVAAPYLVSSSKGLLWIPEAFGNVVRAAVRKDIKTNGLIYREIVDAVISQGQDSIWGNTFPHTINGVKKAIAYLAFFGIEDVEIFIHAGDPLCEALSDQPITKVSWLRRSCIVVAPKDKEYLGFLARLGKTSVVSVVHNPSRGLAIAKA